MIMTSKEAAEQIVMSPLGSGFQDNQKIFGINAVGYKNKRRYVNSNNAHSGKSNVAAVVQ